MVLNLRRTLKRSTLSIVHHAPNDENISPYAHNCLTGGPGLGNTTTNPMGAQGKERSSNAGSLHESGHVVQGSAGAQRTWQDGRLCRIEDNETEPVDRFLAFTVRSRASGSGLPSVLAELKRMHDVAKDDDAETANLFATLVSRKLALDRRMRTQVNRSLHVEPTTQHWSAGIESLDKNVNPDITEEQRRLKPWLQRKFAYQKWHATIGESTSYQGLCPIRAKAASVSRPLRERLLRYLGEKAVYNECHCWGMHYPRPRPVRLRSENMPIEGLFGRPRKLRSLHDLTVDLGRKLLPAHLTSRRRPRRGPRMSPALFDALEDLAASR